MQKRRYRKEKPNKFTIMSNLSEGIVFFCLLPPVSHILGLTVDSLMIYLISSHIANACGSHFAKQEGFKHFMRAWMMQDRGRWESLKKAFMFN